MEAAVLRIGVGSGARLELACNWLRCPLKWWSRQRINELRRQVLFQNIVSLYGVQIASYIIPLVTIPYLARVLGAAGWGLVAFAQSFGSYVTLISEYGFGLSATREIARHREDHEKVANILAGVLGAKALLGAACLVCATVVAWSIPLFREHPILFGAGMFWALGQAINVMWFFQGFERMRLVAAIDVSARALSTAGIFIFIRGPGDEWLVLVVQGIGFYLSAAICMGLAYREVEFRLPRWSSVREALRTGWSMFVFRGSVSLYTVGNAFILGLFVAPRIVGYYAGAEKISRALVSLLNPITQSLYPRLSHLVHRALDRAAHLLKVTLLFMALGGMVAGVCVLYSAPFIVRIILGRGFGPAAPVLELLGWLPLIIGVGAVFGIYWMLPLGMDRAFNTIIISAGVLNIILALLLAPRLGSMGMAWAVVSSESFVTVSMAVYLVNKRTAFWNIRGPNGGVA